jgi:hypothetical protein
LVAVVVLAPYATIRLEYRTALQVQALTILGAIVVALAVGLLRSRPWRSTASGVSPAETVLAPGLLPSKPIRTGLAFYGLAALVGAAVGLASGNSAVLLAGQVLSLSLLPLAAWAGSSLRRDSAALLVLVFPVTICLAASAHFGHWAFEVAHGHPVQRLFFSNTVSVSDLALVALLLALAAAADSRPAIRRGAVFVTVLIALYIIGSGTRSVWLILPLAVLLYRVLAGPGNAGSRSAMKALGLLAIIGVLAAIGFHLWLDRLERPPLLTDEDFIAAATAPRTDADKLAWSAGQSARQLTRPVPVDRSGSYRLSAVVRGGQRGAAVVVLRFFNAEGVRVGSLRLRAPALDRARRLETLGASPTTARTAMIWLITEQGAVGSWEIEGLRCHRLGPRRLAPLLTQASAMEHRLASIASLWPSRQPLTDRSISFRFAEARELSRRLRRAPLLRQLFGHGLGATFRLPDTEPAAKRTGPRGSPQNYIHNYYLFLLFKLGWLGTALMLSALGLWSWHTFRCAWKAAPGPRREFLAAASVSWVAYLLLGLSMPTFLDFRLTPIWGLLLAAIAGDRES